jgi:Zn-dependent protease
MPRLPGPVTIAHVAAVDIAVHWRWAPILVLSTLLAHQLLPVRYPLWQPGTVWLVSVVAIVATEGALLLHELSHALIARGRGQAVERIVFHGFVAETVVSEQPYHARHDAFIALAGPGSNLGLAGVIQIVRMVTESDGPLDVMLTLLLAVNLAMVALSLMPIGPSDGSRAVKAWLKIQVASQSEDQNDQDEQTKWRPTVVTPAATRAIAAAEQSDQQQDHENGQNHAGLVGK